jgi:hypothetical protein
LLEHDIASKCTHRNTIKRIGEKIKTASMFASETEIITSVLRNPFIVDKSNQHCRLLPPEHFGEEVQIDASQEVWFGGSKSTLHLAIDRKKGTFLAGYFHKQETLTGYIHMVLTLLREYGKPIKFVTDNRGVFTNLGVDVSERNVKLTQFGYACKILGIELVTTSVPQRKGGIERANRTAQDRVIAELQLMNIKNIEDANKVLPSILKDLNKKLNKGIVPSNSLYEPITSNEDLIQIFSYKTERTTDNGNCIKYNNKYYQLYVDNKLINVLPQTKCLLMDRIDGQIFVSISNRIFEAREGLSHYENGRLVHPSGLKNIYRYRPPMSHPYKLQSFLEYKNTIKIKNLNFE